MQKCFGPGFAFAHQYVKSTCGIESAGFEPAAVVVIVSAYTWSVELHGV